MTTPLRVALSCEQPFPGLRPFAFADHPFFFGRQDQTFSLYRLLDRSRFIAVVGGSGSGKSSLVRAGLLPLLEEENNEAGSRSWRWCEMRPGDSPLGRLADTLANLSPDGDDPVSGAISSARRERISFALRRSSFGLTEALGEIEGLGNTSLVLVVDQFEELFRNAGTSASLRRDWREKARSREEAAHFAQLLLEACRDRTRDVRVLITMRSDFIGDCARFHGLPEAVSAVQFLVPSLTRDQLEEAIRHPIEKGGATIEPGLVERLLNDCSDEPDQLPVFQHGLMWLWDRAGRPPAADTATGARLGAGGTRAAAQPTAGRHLALEHYEAIGGMAGAISQHGKEILRSLPRPGLELAVEQVFRALSEVDKDGRAIRRALSFAQLVAETGIAKGDVRQVVDRFRVDDCSFLVTQPSALVTLAPDTLIDVGHEALLRRWDRVSGDPEACSRQDEKEKLPWLWAEERDGRHYRRLLDRIEGGDMDLLPPNRVDEAWKRWNEPPRTEAWAERYGGGRAQVEHLLERSRAQLKKTKRRRRYTLCFGAATTVAVVAVLFAFQEAHLERQAAQQKMNEERKAIRSALPIFLGMEQRATQHGKLPVALPRPTVDAKRFDNPATDSKNILTVSDLASLVRGLAYHTRSEYDRAIDDYSRTIDHNSKSDLSDLAYLARGRVHHTRSEYERAIDDYGKAIELDSENGYAYNNRGDAYVAKGNLDRAIADYKQAVELDPDNTVYLIDRGLAYNDKKDHGSAMADYNKAIGLDSENVRAYLSRGFAYFDKKDYGSAIADYNKAIELDPKNALAYVLRGTSHHQREDIASALTDYNKAIDLDSKNASAYFGRGVAYNEKGDLDRALDDYGRAVALDPRNTPYLSARGIGYQDKKDYDRAIADFNLAIEIDPKDADTYNYRGDAHRGKGEYDLAIADYNDAISRKPEGADAYSGRSIAFSAKGEFDQASGDCMQAVQFGEKQVIAAERSDEELGKLGWYAVICGDPAKALDASKCAVALAPDLVWIKTNMAHALMFLGRSEEARDIYFKYRGKPTQNGPWEDVVLRDFEEFRQKRLTNPLMDEIERAFASPQGN